MLWQNSSARIRFARACITLRRITLQVSLRGRSLQTLANASPMSITPNSRRHLLQTLSKACGFYKLLQLIPLLGSIVDSSRVLGRRIVLHIARSMTNRHENDSHIVLFSRSSVADHNSIARLLLVCRAVMISGGKVAWPFCQSVRPRESDLGAKSHGRHVEAIDQAFNEIHSLDRHGCACPSAERMVFIGANTRRRRGEHVGA